MSFNTIDLNTIKTETALGKENYKVDERVSAPVKSRYPLMIYPNGMFDVSKMKGMHVSRVWETGDPDHKKDYYTYAVFIVLDDGLDYRISKKYLVEDAAREELDNYIRELWSIADDFEKHIPSFLK